MLRGLKKAVWVLTLGALSGVVGCGPVMYSLGVAGASEAVEQARQAGAAESAPYEYHYAVEHLNQAREFANEAEYQTADEMATIAEEYGNRARDIARRRQRERGR
ncbi:MAG: DUF4398 domain-containing protein [Myxococcales bacterium]|nr:DUF4398 domain-containing protein [Myxococcales bacterium]